MNQQQLLAQLEYFDMVHDVTVRAIGGFTDDELGFRPQPAMRSPRELIFHIYSQEKSLAEGAQQARITMDALTGSSPEHESAKPEVEALATVADAQAFAKRCHEAGQHAFRSMSEADLARTVESPFGTYPAWRYFSFAYDEHWHHRGQMYSYLRLLGKEPLMLYDYPTG